VSGRAKHHDEKALIAAAQEDPSRFAELYELHFQRVYAYIARRVGERSAAEELTSHVFQQALANLKSFKWRGAPFAAWLFRIAANGIADRAQRARRESPAEPKEIEAQTTLQVNVEQVETLARIYGLVEQLSWDQRRVIRARFVEEKSVREIATELSRSEGAIKQLQFRALQTLRARLSKEDV